MSSSDSDSDTDSTLSTGSEESLPKYIYRRYDLKDVRKRKWPSVISRIELNKNMRLFFCT
jgi:hypothetical protein